MISSLGQEQDLASHQTMLKNTAWLAVTVVLSQIIPVVVAAAAPQESESTNGNKIGLGTVYALHSDEIVDMPVYISLASEVRLRSVSFDLAFPQASLLWVRAEAGIQAGLSVKAEARQVGEESSQAVVRMEIEMEGPGEIENGLIASVRLRTAPGVGLGTIPVSITEVAATSSDTFGEPAVEILGFGANVKVVTPEEYPAVACFFFTH